MGDTAIVSIVHHLRSVEEHPATLLPLYRMVETHYLQSVDGFICKGPTRRRILEKQIGRTMPHVVAYPAGDHGALPDPAAVLHQISTRLKPSGTLHCLVVGNLMRRKG